ncbi:Glu/Leu/Phe/Val family dehydrogenase [Tepidibacter aestuarii]|uniref:Glu/Leu/Phe/Val family dehydrogenase n=1 Tax=Tepidibacter aestuarii TaxID=2925782 RepID=UPI0020C05D19|nr:Glu/Leu/Phe/Val dehydrogenase dimerization domain-containing protein [Tepidibacter aestuarii]CAH2213799.1 Glutamate dehydrogenase [Tepidibacter aestuarii]
MLDKPYVVIEWNDTETDAKGWLCGYNFVNNYCGGGTRMHPSVTKEEVIRLAHTMAYKYTACESDTTGGCKGGIAYDYKASDAKDVLKRYLMAMSPYIKAGVSIGGDLGVDYGDVLEILDELGIGLPQTKAMKADSKIQEGIKNHDEMMGMTYDGFKLYDMITGYGTAYSADEAWKLMDGKKGATVVIQGFGCVGASAAKCMDKLGYKVVGISDANCLVTCENGLDIDELIKHKTSKGEMDSKFFKDDYVVRPNTKWIDVDCDIFIPAALEDVIHKNNANNVKASLICEGANIAVTKEGDDILKERRIAVVPDFVANLGAIRFYDAIIFGYIPKDVVAAVDDVEQLCRKNTRKVFKIAKEEGRYQRDVAMEIFAPSIAGIPDIY